MINAFQDVQKISQGNLDSAIRMWDAMGRNWQAIAMEMGAYSKRSFEDGADAVQRLLGAKSLEQAFEIQSDYARRAYQQYLQELNTLGGMYAGLAKQAMKPLDEAVRQ
ncbi:MAG TPA: phasin family protein [Hyphomicrobium sp.]|nr:phasin family protein [Hyphomicrobium sp.]